MAQINVAIMVDDVPFQIAYVFTDDSEGDKQAQETFKQMVKENGGQDEDVDASTKDGSYTNNHHRVRLIQ